MSREQKLALVLGFALVLIVGVLVSDHLSDASTATVEQVVTDHSAPALGRGDAVEPISPRLLEGAELAQQDPPESALERFTNGARDVVSERIAELRDNPPPAAYQTRSVPTIVMGERPAQERPGNRYTIRAGDGLWAIAEREYGDPQLYSAIAAYNEIDVRDELQVGSTLVLPTIDMLRGGTPKATPKPAPLPAREVPRDAPKTPKTREYTIASGDVLSVVVQRELGTVKRMDEVLKLNPKLDPDRVRVGQVISLPAQ